jgi:hypothetical protein
MRKFGFAALLLVICAAPAFAVWPFHKKPPKDPRFVEHPKTQHQPNLNYKNAPKHKMPSHPTSASK